jgi:hypothetical protein
MIWLTWRQQRFEAALSVLAVCGAAVILAITGTQLLGSFNAAGIPDCLRGIGDGTACSHAISDFTSQVSADQSIISWVAYLPMLLGALLAAPLVLEIEEGSYRLAWTQSVTRLRWTLLRVGLPIVAGVALTAVIAALGSWWLQPSDRVSSPLRPGSFDMQGVLPIAYMLLALSITVCSGVVLRRGIAALALGVATTVGFHFALQTWLRPHFLPPITKVWVTGSAPFTARDWVIQGGPSQNYLYVDTAGNRFSLDQVNAMCGEPTAATKEVWATCLQSRGLGEVIQFQPADRFWAFQGIEVAILIGISVVLLAVATYWLLKRTA